MEDVGGGRDRIGRQEHRKLGQLAGGDEAPSERGVPGDVRVHARQLGGGLDLVGRLEQLGRLAEVVAGLEGQRVGVHHLFGLGEAELDPLQRGLDGTRVHPRDQPEGEEVLGAFGVARLCADLLGGLDGDARHRDLVDGVALETVVAQRVLGVARLGQVALLEGVDVDDQRPARRQVRDIGLQRSRVHRHEDIGRVSRRQDVVVGDVDLERRDAGQRARRCADLSREVRQRRQVVAEDGARAREAVTRELHPVA